MTDPHPTARALVEGHEILCTQIGRLTGIWLCYCNLLRDALTAAHDAGRREGREEMRERTARVVEEGNTIPPTTRHVTLGRIAQAIRQLSLDDAARGEEPKG